MITYRLPLLLIAAALLVALLLGALVRTASAEDDIWRTDFKAALAKAKADKKYLLVDFTGSDWCGWCIKLHGEVFDKEPFKTAAPKQFVLVELDFPQQKELPAELKKQNEELRKKYDIKGFPTVLLLDAKGEVIARTGYREGGPDEYLKQLASFGKIYENVVALKGRLDAVQGIARAKLLDEIVEGYKKLGNESDDVDTWSKEIIALDPDNKAGLKLKYEFPMKIAAAEKLAESGKSAEALDLLDKALALKGVSGDLLQEGYMAKAGILETESKFADLLPVLKAAKEAAPQSEHAGHIGELVEHFTKVADADQLIHKLEPQLAGSKGLDRARLLDKLITATEKLPENPPAAEKVEKWSKEVIELDADNKAGLKKKYQIQAALNEVMELVGNGKEEEGSAALDKVLKTPGIGGEELQKAYFLKAQISNSQHRTADEASFLKKALDAAPDSEMAPMLKRGIAEMEKGKKDE